MPKFMMRPFFRSTHTSPIILICLIIVLFLTDQRNNLASTQRNNKEKFQKEIVQKQLYLQSQLTHINKQLENPAISPWQVIKQSPINQRKDYSCFLFQNKTLSAWSDATIPLPDKPQILLNSSIILLQNGWYLVEKQSSPPFLAVGLCKIKSEYPFQNQFLENSFQEDFSIRGDLTINISETKDGQKIYGKDGNYLLSLNQLTTKERDLPLSYFTLLLWFLIIGIACQLFSKLLKKILAIKYGLCYFLIMACITFSAFFFLVWIEYPKSLFALDLFSPIHFAASWWLPSLGVYLIFSMLKFFFSYTFFNHFRKQRVSNPKDLIPKKAIFSYLIAQTIGLTIFLTTTQLLQLLVNNSSGSSLFFKVTDLTYLASIRIGAIALLFISFILIQERLSLLFQPRIKRWQQLTFIWLLVSLGALITALLATRVLYEAFAFFGLLSSIRIYFSKRKSTIHAYTSFIWFVLLFSLFTSYLLYKLEFNKERQNRQLLMDNLAFESIREDDPVAEMYLQSIEKRIIEDQTLHTLLASNQVSNHQLKEYLITNYFNGFWSRYDLQVIPCWPGSNLYIEGTEEKYHCYAYFSKMLQRQGNVLPENKYFYFLDNNNGRVSYFGAYTFYENTSLETRLFIELNSKPFFIGLGYPELLISKKEKEKLQALENYSYAKYINGHLVKRTGKYSFPINSDLFPTSQTNNYFYNTKEFSHLVYSPTSNVTLVLSKQAQGASNILIAFSIIFIGFSFVGACVLMLVKKGKKKQFSLFSIQERIQVAFVGLVFVLLIAVAGGSIYYSTHQFKKKNRALLFQKLESVLIELETLLGEEERLTDQMEDYLMFQLQKLSNVFYSDINLYKLNGNLLASSRPELFKKGIIGTLMNPAAFTYLSSGNHREFIHEEQIGNLQYTSAYVPFMNQNKKILAFINLPHFVGHSELRNEVSSMVVAIINFYLIFMLLVIGIAVIVARRITFPLLLIQDRLKRIDLGKRNKKIAYQGNDEIGELIQIYNRMVDELSSSAQKLAQSERETAWREMAKQIAHEIKNPLTPMKLSIQYLQRSWKDNSENIDNTINKVTNTLIEQIDNLSRIASEFSNFAKMPEAQKREIDLLEKIKNCIVLFEKGRAVEFSLNTNNIDTFIIYADGKQMISVFNNLFKNAIQSVPPETTCKIEVQMKQEEDQVIISIADNGKGIPHKISKKLFEPSFTTKTSGMGMGLAIVKNIITNTGGEIWFSTKEGEGSVFYVKLPLQNPIL